LKEYERVKGNYSKLTEKIAGLKKDVAAESDKGKKAALQKKLDAENKKDARAKGAVDYWKK